jgi:hypothetical protein
LTSGSLIGIAGTTPIQFLRNLHTDFTWPLSVADWHGNEKTLPLVGYIVRNYYTGGVAGSREVTGKKKKSTPD